MERGDHFRAPLTAGTNFPGLRKPLRHILTVGIAAARLNCTALALTLPVPEDTSTSTIAVLSKAAGREASLTVSDSRQGLIPVEAGAFADSIADAGKARLIIYLNKVTAPGALTVHRITEDWSEGGASVPAFGPTPIATIPSASVVAKQYVIIDVTATVQAWLKEPGKDFGFAIAGSGGAQVLIGAKEGPGSGYSAKPRPLPRRCSRSPALAESASARPSQRQIKLLRRMWTKRLLTPREPSPSRRMSP